MTLLEILVAMLVLLVGIYTVARGFPLMLQNIRGEGDRTTMARMAEETMARLSDNQNGLPDVITGGADVSNYTFSKDMVATRSQENLDSGIATYPNAQEDITEVRGETFRVPAPYHTPGAAYTDAPGWYALSQGPAAYTAGYPYVYMLVPLQERFDDPRTSASNPNPIDYGGNWFYVDKAAGKIVIPLTVTTTGNSTRTWNSTNVVVDYAWTKTGPGGTVSAAHYVQAETPSDVADFPTSGTAKGHECRVHPAHTNSGAPATNVRLVTGQTRVWAKVDFGRNVGSTIPPSGEFTLESQYGATIGFSPADAGLTLKVDYQLRTTTDVGDTPRRLLLMHEEQSIKPSTDRTDTGGAPYADVRLAFKHLDDEPIFTYDVQGNVYNPAAPVHVLAVDLTTGQVHTDNSGGNPFILSDPVNLPSLPNGYADGILSVPLQIGGAPADYIGHVWRFYYRTLERHNVQVQKAPRVYLDADTAQTYLAGYLPGGQDEAASLADVDYRTYKLNLAAAPNATDSSQVGVLEFGHWVTGGAWAESLNTSGFTIAVNYSYWWTDPATNQPARYTVYGELHTVPPDARTITLNHATLDDTSHRIEILAVNGVSARARGWWQTRSGQQKQLDVETVFLANALGLVPTVR